jgi:hypothetical protein
MPSLTAGSWRDSGRGIYQCAPRHGTGYTDADVVPAIDLEPIPCLSLRIVLLLGTKKEDGKCAGCIPSSPIARLSSRRKTVEPSRGDA